MPNAKVADRDLLSAAWDGNAALVKDMLNAGVDVDSKQNEGEAALATPLMLAVIKGYSKIVRLLLKRGADVNAQDYAGYTALRFAQEVGYPQIVSLLKKAGAGGYEC